MAASSKKSLALDTNLLLDLAEGNDFPTISGKNLPGGVTVWLCPDGSCGVGSTREGGLHAAMRFRKQGLGKARRLGMSAVHVVRHEAGHCPSVRGTVARPAAHPGNRTQRREDSGASFTHANPLLVTSDKHLLDTDEEALLLAFNDADLLPVHPSHPKRLLKALR